MAKTPESCTGQIHCCDNPLGHRAQGLERSVETVALLGFSLSVRHRTTPCERRVKDRHRDTHTETHRERHTETHRDTQTDRHTDRHTDTQTDRHTNRHTDTQTDTQTHRHTHRGFGCIASCVPSLLCCLCSVPLVSTPFLMSEWREVVNRCLHRDERDSRGKQATAGQRQPE